MRLLLPSGPTLVATAPLQLLYAVAPASEKRVASEKRAPLLLLLPLLLPPMPTSSAHVEQQLQSLTPKSEHIEMSWTYVLIVIIHKGMLVWSGGRVFVTLPPIRRSLLELLKVQNNDVPVFRLALPSSAG